jgi:predicted NAD/FAD-dependent oxidoreductase
MARERYGNGYKGRAATRRKMRANFRGFADHSARSLKPVHGHVGRRVGRRVGFGERLAG